MGTPGKNQPVYFDYRGELHRSVCDNDTASAKECIADVCNFLQEALDEAAVRGNLDVVEMLLRHTTVQCSGFLMEELIFRGLMDMATILIRSGRYWGSAKDQYVKALRPQSEGVTYDGQSGPGSVVQAAERTETGGTGPVEDAPLPHQ